ncbi:MAG: hypothetical protein WA121_10585 [Syntrophales bacterium]
MFDLSFRKVGSLTIYTKDSKRISIPDLNTLMAIDSVLGILKEILKNYDKDYLENKEIIDEFPIKDQATFNLFSRREVWRIGSFILFALNLKNILKEEYEKLYDIATKVGASRLPPKEDLVKRRKNEVQKFIKYRNKIFAHTAFGSPKPEDNQSMRMTSLLYFAGDLISISKSGIGFGGICVKIGSENTPEFESIDHTVVVLEFEEHFLKWHAMFSDLVDTIKPVSDSNFEKIFGQVNHIVKE